jgi:hypothetical protein
MSIRRSRSHFSGALSFPGDRASDNAKAVAELVVIPLNDSCPLNVSLLLISLLLIASKRSDFDPTRNVGIGLGISTGPRASSTKWDENLKKAMA